MTRNQIAFAEHKETQRHNRVSERHEHQDVATRKVQAEAATSQAATARRNSTINWWLAQETQRAHLAQESESYRSHLAQEQEAYRSHSATEELARYSAMTDASSKSRQAQAALTQAAAATSQARTRDRELDELVRSHKVNETISSNTLAESIRHNIAYEKQQAAQTAASRYATDVSKGVALANLAETTRSHKEQEKVATSQALSASKTAAASETRASADLTKTQIERVKADAATKQADAAYIRAVGSAVRDGTAAAKDIFNTIGGFFR